MKNGTVDTTGISVDLDWGESTNIARCDGSNSNPSDCGREDDNGAAIGDKPDLESLSSGQRMGRRLFREEK